MNGTARFDVVVIGAGPAGAATARRLAQAGCRTLLLERGQLDGPRAGESLAPAVRPLLCELGVWRDFEALAPVPSYGTRSVWGSAQAEAHSHLMTPYGTGFHVARDAFDRMLAQSAASMGAELRMGARVTRCAPAANGGFGLELAVEGRRVELSAASVVDAAGRSSPVARWLGARRVLFDRLTGIGATVACETAADQGFTLVEATQTGWWYSAPCARELLVTMLMTDGDLDAAQQARTRTGFLRALAATSFTHARVLPASALSEPRVYSAVSQRLVRAERNMRWLAVGDAALSVDPISGSGVVRALRTAREGAQAILAVLAGEHSAIAHYEHARDTDCTQYLHERAAYYGAETRFPSSGFWQRRRPAVHRSHNPAANSGTR